MVERQGPGRRATDTCQVHMETMRRIEDGNDKSQGNEIGIASIKSSQRTTRVWVTSTVAAGVVMFAAIIGIGHLALSSRLDKIESSVMTASKDITNFIVSSSNDRTELRAEVNEIKRDVDELKKRLRIK